MAVLLVVVWKGEVEEASHTALMLMSVSLHADFFFYCATLQNLLIRSNSFLVESLGSSIHKSVTAVNGENFTSSFQYWWLLLYLLTWLLWLGFSVLRWTGVARVDALVQLLFFEGNLSIFYSLVWCQLWAYHRWSLFMLRHIPIHPICSEFLS